MHHQRMWASSLAVIPQTLSLPPAVERVGSFSSLQMFHTHTQKKKNKPQLETGSSSSENMDKLRSTHCQWNQWNLQVFRGTQLSE